MLESILWGIVLVELLYLYFTMLLSHINERKLYPSKKTVYIRDKESLLYNDYGNLLTLTAKGQTSVPRIHYLLNLNMVVEK